MQVGNGLLEHFKSSASKLVEAAGGSAKKLVDLITAHFPGFRDHAIYKGQQVGHGSPLRGKLHI